MGSDKCQLHQMPGRKVGGAEKKGWMVRMHVVQWGSSHVADFMVNGYLWEEGKSPQAQSNAKQRLLGGEVHDVSLVTHACEAQLIYWDSCRELTRTVIVTSREGPKPGAWPCYF